MGQLLFESDSWIHFIPTQLIKVTQPGTLGSKDIETFPSWNAAIIFVRHYRVSKQRVRKILQQEPKTVNGYMAGDSTDPLKSGSATLIGADVLL